MCEHLKLLVQPLIIRRGFAACSKHHGKEEEFGLCFDTKHARLN